MNNVIPILPCTDIRTQTAFYQQLGFEVKGLYVSPNPYAVVQFGEIELHFWGNRKLDPSGNSSMCFIRVDDVDAINALFTGNLKKHFGKIPRSGFPRITKVRDLLADRRFTLTDVGGNTFFVGTPLAENAVNFYRTLDNEAFAKKFAVLYDIVYSKEAPEMAAETLPKYGFRADLLGDLDRAKYLLVLFEIQMATGQPPETAALQSLLAAHKGSNGDWEKIEARYLEISRGSNS